MQLQDYVQLAKQLNLVNLQHYIGASFSDCEMRDFNKRYLDLAEIARQHFAQRRFRTSNSGSNPWAVHPSCEEIDNDGEKPLKMQRLLDYIQRTRGDHRTILVSDAIDYVLADHVYVEEVLFDGVVLTQNNSGNPLDASDLNPFINAKEHLVGGCYVSACVDDFVQALQKATPQGRIKVVRKWTYTTNPSFGEKVYAAFYSLTPQAIRERMHEPRSAEDIFIQK